MSIKLTQAQVAELAKISNPELRAGLEAEYRRQQTVKGTPGVRLSTTNSDIVIFNALPDRPLPLGINLKAVRAMYSPEYIAEVQEFLSKN